MIKPRYRMAAKHEQRSPVSLTSHWATVGGWRMHYRKAGKGQHAVVLVHGLTVSGNYLLPTAVELADHFTVYVPDLPGFGDSEKPRRVLGIVEMAETLKAWMDAIGLERAYLLGNSLGCHTIAVMAARHREHVSGTIFVSPVGDPGGRNIPRLGLRALNDFVREPWSFWTIMIHNLWQAGVKRTVLTLRNLQQFRLEAWLPQVHVPALVVGGGRDRIVPISWIGRVTALLPQGQVSVIKEAGHVPNYSHPARLAALIRSFAKGGNGSHK